LCAPATSSAVIPSVYLDTPPTAQVFALGRNYRHHIADLHDRLAAACSRGHKAHLDVSRNSLNRRAVLGVTTIAATALLALTASAGNPFAYAPPAPETTRAYQYAAMSDALCLAELRERGVPFERLDHVRGVQTPVRFTGPVRGVVYRQTYREQLDPESASTFLDCRLALAIDDMSQILARHDVVGVGFLSMYRPGHMKPGVRHPAGRAIDVATVTLRDGTEYSVHHHFFGKLGAKTCGHGAAEPRFKHPGADLWREVVCALDDTRSFNLVLSPNYDWGHRDHLHLEVRSDIRWYLTQ